MASAQREKSHLMSKQREISQQEAEFLQSVGMGNKVVTRYFINGVAPQRGRPKGQQDSKPRKRRTKKLSPGGKHVVDAPVTLGSRSYHPQRQAIQGRPNTRKLVWDAAETILTTPGTDFVAREKLVALITGHLNATGHRINRGKVSQNLTYLLKGRYLHYGRS